jgi:hypothetical protein
MSRRVYLLGLGLALLALAFITTEALIGPRPGVTAQNVRRIRPGMTLADVTRLLGKSPNVPSIEAGLFRRRHPDAGSHGWLENGAVAVILIGDDGFVQSADWVEIERPIRSPDLQDTAPLARLRAWLGW